MKFKTCILIGLVFALSGCGNDDDNPVTGADTSNNFSTISRAAFAAPENGMPTQLNDREIVQDVTDPAAYDDLLTTGS